jgi:alkylhydroperoxidase family enzyme
LDQGIKRREGVLDNGEMRTACIRTIAEKAAAGSLGEVYREIADPSGRVANILKVQSLNPAALGDHAALYGTLMFGDSPLSRAEREAIAVVISAENRCHY